MRVNFFAFVVSQTATALLTAGPPLIIEEPATPGRQTWEVNVSYQVERIVGEWEHQLPEFDINYGFGDRDEWNLVLHPVAVQNDEIGTSFGLGDTVLGWKSRFLDSDNGGPQAAVIVKWVIPSAGPDVALADAGAGLIPERNGGQWKTEVAATFGRHLGCRQQLFLYGELTYIAAWEQRDTDNIEAGAAVEWEFSDDLRLLASIIASRYESPDDTDFVGFEAGIIYQFDEQTALLASSGRSFRRNGSGAPTWLGFIGLQRTWATRRFHGSVLFGESH